MYTCIHRTFGQPFSRPRIFTGENIGVGVGVIATGVTIHQAVVEKQSRRMERLIFSAENAEAIKKGRSTELALEWSNVARDPCAKIEKILRDNNRLTNYEHIRRVRNGITDSLEIFTLSTSKFKNNQKSLRSSINWVPFD